MGEEVDWYGHHRNEWSSFDSQRRPPAQTVCVYVCVEAERRMEERRVEKLIIHTHSDQKYLLE